MKNKVGSLDVVKEKSVLLSFDAVPSCDQESCPASEMCKYINDGKCEVMLQYLQSVEDVIVRNYKNKLDEAQMLRVGMHLIPLYKMLVKFKIEELAVVRATYTNRSGEIKVHAIYQAIRDTITKIELLWKTIGLGEIEKETEKSVFSADYIEVLMEG